mmetsp:Transcript_91085/g.254501  ORF Transcript_91085/g.254501 Transcript_91085/m.254501 type:complete len:355 (-) Transcript_91085:786-1850(-)
MPSSAPPAVHVVLRRLGNRGEVVELRELGLGHLNRVLLHCRRHRRFRDHCLHAYRPRDDLCRGHVTTPLALEDKELHLAELRLEEGVGTRAGRVADVHVDADHDLPSAAASVAHAALHARGDGIEVLVLLERSTGALQRMLLHRRLQRASEDLGLLHAGESEELRGREVAGLEHDHADLAEGDVEVRRVQVPEAEGDVALLGDDALPDAAVRGLDVLADALHHVVEADEAAERLPAALDGVRLHLVGHGGLPDHHRLCPSLRHQLGARLRPGLEQDDLHLAEGHVEVGLVGAPHREAGVRVKADDALPSAAVGLLEARLDRVGHGGEVAVRHERRLCALDGPVLHLHGHVRGAL